MNCLHDATLSPSPWPSPLPREREIEIVALEQKENLRYFKNFQNSVFAQKVLAKFPLPGEGRGPGRGGKGRITNHLPIHLKTSHPLS